MGRTNQTTWQWLNRAGSLLAAWLVLLLSAGNVHHQPVTARQHYISYDVPRQSAGKPDVASAVCNHAPAARIGARPGHSFGPTVGWFPYLLPALSWGVDSQVAGQSQYSCYSFRFLRLIFEHQIAINAP
ncbi:hypothetical protein [Fibrella arboris]|uniref:hypothetical protein n=1 Tax=Fibrella arboris TaxID=3242486 RepID=UPI0035225DD7